MQSTRKKYVDHVVDESSWHWIDTDENLKLDEKTFITTKCNLRTSKLK